MEDKAFVDLKRYMELLDTEKAYRELLKEHGELTRFIYNEAPEIVEKYIKMNDTSKGKRSIMTNLADLRTFSG